MHFFKKKYITGKKCIVLKRYTVIFVEINFATINWGGLLLSLWGMKNKLRSITTLTSSHGGHVSCSVSGSAEKIVRNGIL